MSDLPIDTIFELGEAITPEQEQFLETYGFVHFRGVAKPQEIEALVSNKIADHLGVDR